MSGKRRRNTASERDTAKPVRAKPRIDAAVRARLGQDLRGFYADMLAQPLPERFAKLLDALADGSRNERDSRS